MNNIINSKEDLVRNINKVLKSKKSKLSQRDRELLIVVRENLKKAKTKYAILRVIVQLCKIFGIIISLIKKE